MRNLPDWFFALLKKIGTERRYQASFGLWLLGLTMITGSHLLEEYHLESFLIRTLLLEVGIACIIAAIAEFILLKHASEIFQQEVQQEIKILERAGEILQQEVRKDMEMLGQANVIFREEVRQDMKILSHCQEHELVDIMPPRNQKHRAKAVEEIKLAIEHARGEICIIAFTLRDILNSRTSLIEPLTDLFDHDEDVNVKLLLIDPTSDAAHIRFMAEGGSDTSFVGSKLHKALRTNFYEVEEIVENAEKNLGNPKGFTIEARFYNILPSFYMVSTSNEVFIEPYHLGHNGGDSTIGGIVPLFRFSSKSPMYHFAQSHFYYIFENFQNGQQTGADVQQVNGYIRVKTMDEVSQEIDMRLGRSERRSKTSPVNTERRSASDRRYSATPRVRSAAAARL